MPQACKFCPYVCASNANLKKHVKGKHTKEGAYRCNLCDMAFNWCNMLKDHKVKVHCNQGEDGVQVPKAKRGRPKKQHNISSEAQGT